MSEKFCKDCKYQDDIYCDAPNAPKINPEDGLPVTIFTTRISRWNPEFCGMEGKWFEPKAPDPGEGWRLVKEHEQYQYGDEKWTGKEWEKWNVDTSTYHRNASVLLFRRRITPELERCPCGHEARLVGCHPFFVQCGSGAGCWSGPNLGTREAAKSAWNTVVRAYREAREKAGETKGC